MWIAGKESWVPGLCFECHRTCGHWNDCRTGALADSQARMRELKELVEKAKPIMEWAGGNVCESWLRQAERGSQG